MHGQTILKKVEGYIKTLLQKLACSCVDCSRQVQDRFQWLAFVTTEKAF
jgi:hypothetical protein